VRATHGRRDLPSRLIFSLWIVSGRPLAPLGEFERRWARTRQEADVVARVGGNHLYGIGRFSVEESAWAARADLVDAGIAALLERLESTGFSANEMCRSDVFVRAYFRLPPGAETIRADTVDRLSRINATLWIDA
jgi:hypothetical protein